MRAFSKKKKKFSEIGLSPSKVFLLKDNNINYDLIRFDSLIESQLALTRLYPYNMATDA